jgi:hypothetical protein
VTNDVDTLATALYATTDDMLKEHPDLAPWRPPVGITPRLSDAELVTLATMQAILGYTSEAKWLRHARAHLRHLFPYLPQQPGYNKRLRKAAGLMRSVNRILATISSVWSDDVWVVDSTPVECGRSRETVKRSDLAGWAEYGYCASRSRFFWGLRLHLVCTLQGLPIAFALTGAKADEREGGHRGGRLPDQRQTGNATCSTNWNGEQQPEPSSRSRSSTRTPRQPRRPPAAARCPTVPRCT